MGEIDEILGIINRELVDIFNLLSRISTLLEKTTPKCKYYDLNLHTCTFGNTVGECVVLTRI